MIAKGFDQISKEDIDALLENAVREGRSIEYKSELPGTRDDDKKEFLADVSSFANAAGGDLIYGIDEARDSSGKTTGIPQVAPGLCDINADHEIRRLENILRDGLEPRIPGIQIKMIDGFPLGPIIVFRVPHSWAAPHMVTYKASPRFFSRTAAGKAPLDVPEIRAAFLQSETIAEKIRQFRENRLGNIVAGDTPVQLYANAIIVLHLIPVANFASHDTVDTVIEQTHLVNLRPISASGWDGRRNLDGYVTYAGASAATDEQVCSGYTQVFRNGTIEAVDTEILSGNGNAKNYIPSVAFERDIIASLSHYLRFYKTIDLDPPFVVMLSILGVKGFYMYVDPNRRSRVNRIDRENLLIPEVLVEDSNAEPSTLLRPIFDMVWQACGFAKSLNYENGKWSTR